GTSLDAVRCETPQLRGGSRMILPPGRVSGPAGADSRGPSAIPPSEPRIEITANAPARTTASTPARAVILRRRPVLRPVFEPRPRPACVESDTWTSPVDVYVSVSAPPSSFFIVFDSAGIPKVYGRVARSRRFNRAVPQDTVRERSRTSRTTT